MTSKGNIRDAYRKCTTSDLSLPKHLAVAFPKRSEKASRIKRAQSVSSLPFPKEPNAQAIRRPSLSKSGKSFGKARLLGDVCPWNTPTF